ncbi:MAG: hypothetical protein EPN30_06750 [Actinomycetota bacterium]|nr:MAG: hypothetical protein EPN30_06750 [Actinomycetota bacterium]
MKNKNQSIPVLTDPSDICRAFVALKDIEILFYRRSGPIAEIAVQQVIGDIFCNNCGSRAYVKDRPWVSYVVLPFGGRATRLLRIERAKQAEKTLGSRPGQTGGSAEDRQALDEAICDKYEICTLTAIRQCVAQQLSALPIGLARPSPITGDADRLRRRQGASPWGWPGRYPLGTLSVKVV